MMIYIIYIIVKIQWISLKVFFQIINNNFFGKSRKFKTYFKEKFYKEENKKYLISDSIELFKFEKIPFLI